MFNITILYPSALLVLPFPLYYLLIDKAWYRVGRDGFRHTHGQKDPFYRMSVVEFNRVAGFGNQQFLPPTTTKMRPAASLHDDHDYRGLQYTRIDGLPHIHHRLVSRESSP